MKRDWLALGLSIVAAVAAISALVVTARLEQEIRTLQPGPARTTVDASHRDGSGAGTPIVPGDSPRPADPAAAALRDLELRLAALEKREPPVVRPVDRSHPDAAALRSIVTDRTQPGAVRVDALVRLRRMRPDERTPEVAKSMVELLQTSPEPEVRADICRNLSGVVLPELGVELMTRLRADNDESTREEAAESLEPYLEEVGVAAALDYARLNDPSEAVRKQAATTLSKRQPR